MTKRSSVYSVIYR